MSSRRTDEVRYISECFIKPKHELKEQRKLINLSAWDIPLLSVRYMQKGLLYPLVSGSDNNLLSSLLDQLKESLSVTLIHFYPLAGQLHTQLLSDSDEKGGHRTSSLVSIDPSKGPGVKFIHAAAVDLISISDLLSPKYVPPIVDSFFDPYRAVSHDGHHLPLLTIQVTQLIDGFFIGCSMNHACADGVSFWHFFNSWSEIFTKKFNTTTDAAVDLSSTVNLNNNISRTPIHTRWSEPTVKLPFSHPDEFIRRFNHPPPPLRNRIFHFSSESIRKIKSRANETDYNVISSLQAIAALLWRCITRARQVPADVEVGCWLVINTRKRLDPPLSDDYFGNYVQPGNPTTTAKDLIDNSLGSAALMINQAVNAYNDRVVRHNIACWTESPPMIYEVESGGVYVSVVGSQWFDVYGNEFGMKPVAVLSGDGSKTDGRVIFGPGRDLGTMDLEICLSPDSMTALENDVEFMDALN